MILNGLISDGSIILFLGAPPPTPPVPCPEPPAPLPISYKNQYTDQRAQGYPQMRGLLVIHSVLTAAMGVHVDELTQP